MVIWGPKYRFKVIKIWEFAIYSPRVAINIIQQIGWIRQWKLKTRVKGRLVVWHLWFQKHKNVVDIRSRYPIHRSINPWKVCSAFHSSKIKNENLNRLNDVVIDILQMSSELTGIYRYILTRLIVKKIVHITRLDIT